MDSLLRRASAGGRKIIPEPSLNVSENLILTAIQRTQTCEPRLTAGWNSGERCAAAVTRNDLSGVLASFQIKPRLST